MEAREIDDIVACIEAAPLSDAILTVLRSRFPGRHFTYCTEDDICGPEPHVERETFHLYLVSSAQHCLSFTGALDQASGVVIAELDPESDDADEETP